MSILSRLGGPSRACVIAILASILTSQMSGCSGGDEKETVNAGSTDCNNASIAVGDTITIPSAGIDPESLDSSSENPVTVLIGGHPVDPDDITIDADGTMEIAVKSLISGKVNVESASGAQFKVLCRNIQVVPVPKGTETACSDAAPCADDQVCQDGSCVAATPEPAESTPPSGDGTEPAGGEGETIIPTEPGGTTTDDDGDGVANNIDACPGTGPGIIIDATGCPAPSAPPGGGGGTTPTPTAATINSFTVTKSTATGVALATWKVHWSVSNAKAAYVWGNIFNREAADAGLSADDRCARTGSRYLVTTAAGDEISANPTAQSHINNAPFLEGVLCTTSKCKDYAAPSGGDEVNPNCRIDLKTAGGQVIANKDVYTRSLIGEGTACLVVQGTDNVWKKQCKEIDAPEAKVTISSGDVTLSSAVGKIAVKFDYTNAILAANVVRKKVTGTSPWAYTSPLTCTPKPGVTSFDSKKGTGHWEGTCEVAKIKNLYTLVDIGVTGIGLNNKDVRQFRIKFETPTLTFDFANGKTIPNCDQGSSLPSADCSGNVKFKWKLVRSYAIRDLKTNVLTNDTTHWAKSVKLYSGNEVKKTINIGPDDDGTFDMKRDHDRTAWKAVGTDLDDQKFAEIGREWKYTARFNVNSNWSWSYDCSIDDCDAWIFEGDCCSSTNCGNCDSGDVSDCRNPNIHVHVEWNGYHIKEVQSTCEGSFGGQPSANSYGYQHNSWDKNHGGWTLDGCTIKAKTYDNSWIQRDLGRMHFDNNC